MVNQKIEFNTEDLKHAFELHYNSQYPIRSKFMLISGVVLLLLGVFFLINDPFENLPYVKYTLVGLGAFYIVFYFYRKNKLVDRAVKSFNFLGKYDLVVNKEYFGVKGAKGISYKKWQEYTHAAENNFCILLYFGETQFYIIPKRVFSQADLKILHEQMKLHISKIIKK